MKKFFKKGLLAIAASFMLVGAGLMVNPTFKKTLGDEPVIKEAEDIVGINENASFTIKFNYDESTGKTTIADESKNLATQENGSNEIILKKHVLPSKIEVSINKNGFYMGSGSIFGPLSVNKYLDFFKEELFYTKDDNYGGNIAPEGKGTFNLTVLRTTFENGKYHYYESETYWGNRFFESGLFVSEGCSTLLNQETNAWSLDKFNLYCNSASSYQVVHFVSITVYYDYVRNLDNKITPVTSLSFINEPSKNVDYRLGVAIDSSIEDIICNDTATYGVEITMNSRTEYINLKGRTAVSDNDKNLLIAVVDFGDILQEDNQGRTDVEFAVHAYVEVGSDKYVGTKTTRFNTLRALITYYITDKNVSKSVKETINFTAKTLGIID